MLHSEFLLFFSVCIVLTVFYMGLLLLEWIITEEMCYCAGGKRPLFVKSYLEK